jgi:hypothetical protein
MATTYLSDVDDGDCSVQTGIALVAIGLLGFVAADQPSHPTTRATMPDPHPVAASTYQAVMAVIADGLSVSQVA